MGKSLITASQRKVLAQRYLNHSGFSPHRGDPFAQMGVKSTPPRQISPPSKKTFKNLDFFQNFGI